LPKEEMGSRRASWGRGTEKKSGVGGGEFLFERHLEAGEPEGGRHERKVGAGARELRRFNSGGRGKERKTVGAARFEKLQTEGMSRRSLHRREPSVLTERGGVGG